MVTQYERKSIMNKKSKIVFSILGEHFLNIIISLALICVAGAVFKSKTWLVSVLTGLVYLTSLYSRGWRNSGKDYRLVNAKVAQAEAEGLVYKRYTGFIDALVLVIVSVVFWFAGTFAGNVGFVIYRVYNFAFVFLFDVCKPKFVMEVLVIVLPYLAYGLGYVAGKNKKTFVSQHIGKLIYKSKKTTNKLKR